MCYHMFVCVCDINNNIKIKNMLQNNNNSKPPDRLTDQPAGQTQQSERRHTQKKKTSRLIHQPNNQRW